MNSPLASIAWKEWREHRWKLASLAAIAVCVPTSLLWIGDDVNTERYAAPVMLVYFAMVPLAAVFLATGAAAGERSHGTLPILQTLPCSLRVHAIVKLLLAVSTIVLAILATVVAWVLVAFLSGEVEGPKGVGELVDGFVGMLTNGPFVSVIVFATSLVIWVAALGVNSESEVRAAAISLGVIVGIWGAIALAAYLTTDDQSTQAPIAWRTTLSAALPGGVFGTLQAGWSPLALLLPFLATHVPLALWYVVRYGRIEERRAVSPQPVERAAEVPAWLGAPQPSPLRALLWKQTRQNQPLVVAGFVAAVVLIVLTVASQRAYEIRQPYADSALTAMNLGTQTAVWFTMFGCCVAFVAGLGVGANDLTPRLETFWRSRPIRPGLWYAAALVSGLGLVLVAFGLPGVVGVLLVAGSQGEASGLLAGPIAVILLGFASATLAGVVIRHTVYASLIAICLFLTSYMTVVARIEAEAEALACLAWIAIGVAMLLLAWLAVQKNWSLTP